MNPSETRICNLGEFERLDSQILFRENQKRCERLAHYRTLLITIRAKRLIKNGLTQYNKLQKIARKPTSLRKGELENKQKTNQVGL